MGAYLLDCYLHSSTLHEDTCNCRVYMLHKGLKVYIVGHIVVLLLQAVHYKFYEFC